MNPEHLEPVRAVTPDAPSRARSVALAALPIVVLLAVAGAGVLGRGSADTPNRIAAAGPSSLSPAASSWPEQPTPDADAAILRAHGFPTEAIGLPVRSVAASLEQHRERGAGVGAGVQAVAGWLAVLPHRDCPADTHDSDLLCRRSTVLLDRPDPIPRDGEEAGSPRSPGVHLHPQALPGLSLDVVAEHQIADTGAAVRPVPAVVVGRFGDPRLSECMRSPRHCADTFAIERLIWIDGEWQLRRAERTPGLADVRVSGKVLWYIVEEAIQRSGVVLSEVLVPRDALARIDPAADRAISMPVSGPVWYVRTMLPSGTARDVGWAVIEDATGAVLAADPDGLTTLDD